MNRLPTGWYKPSLSTLAVQGSGQPLIRVQLHLRSHGILSCSGPSLQQHRNNRGLQLGTERTMQMPQEPCDTNKQTLPPAAVSCFGNWCSACGSACSSMSCASCCVYHSSCRCCSNTGRPFHAGLLWLSVWRHGYLCHDPTCGQAAGLVWMLCYP